MNIFHFQLGDQLGEGFGGESFSKDIITLFCRADIAGLQNLSIYFLFNLEAVNIKKFYSIMIEVIMRNAYG